MDAIGQHPIICPEEIRADEIELMPAPALAALAMTDWLRAYARGLTGVHGRFEGRGAVGYRHGRLVLK